MLTSTDVSATQYGDLFVVSSHSANNSSSFCKCLKQKWSHNTLQIVATALHNCYCVVARLFPLYSLTSHRVPFSTHVCISTSCSVHLHAQGLRMTKLLVFSSRFTFDTHYETQRCIRGKERFTSRCVEDGEWTELVLCRCKADKVSCNVAVTFALSKIAAVYSNRRLQAKQPLDCTLSTNDS